MTELRITAVECFLAGFLGAVFLGKLALWVFG